MQRGTIERKRQVILAVLTGSLLRRADFVMLLIFGGIITGHDEIRGAAALLDGNPVGQTV